MITQTELEELIREHGLAPYVYIKNEKEQATWTKHKYNLEAGQDENITILGQLDPDYKLTLSYW